MKRTILLATVSCFCFFVASGVIAQSQEKKQEADKQSEEIRPGKEKGKQERFFAHPLPKVKEAIIDAMKSVEFEVKKENGYQIEARRKRHIGVMVGSGGVAWVMVGRKWGLLDKTGKSVIEPTFDSARKFNEGPAAVKVGKKWGFVDQTGKLAINTQFDDAGDFSAGLAPALTGKQWGYIDKTGAVKITPQFAQARKFSEDLAAVKTGKQWGFINPAGQVVINEQFDEANEFTGGLAKVRAGKKDGYIDRSGAFVWPHAKQQ